MFLGNTELAGGEAVESEVEYFIFLEWVSLMYIIQKSSK
jgi:hypothetical protein